MATSKRVAPNLYAYQGKRKTSYFTILPGNVRKPLGHDLIGAKRMLLDIEEGRSVAGTVGELLDDHIAAIKLLIQKGKKGPRALIDAEEEVAQLRKAFGQMEPAAVRPMHVWRYLHKARGAKAPVRANREVSRLQKVFNHAIGQGIVDVNPCVGVERNDETPRDRLVEDDELRALCRMAFRKPEDEPEEQRPLVNANGKPMSRLNRDGRIRLALAAIIAYLTGKAQGQVLKLTRDALNEEGVAFDQRKRGASTFIRYSRLLKRAIRSSLAMPATVTPLFVVHNRDGGRYSPQGFKAMWNRLMWQYVAEGGEWFTFHDLRAKAATDLAEQGRKASEVTGHRQEATVARIYDRRRVRKADAVR